MNLKRRPPVLPAIACLLILAATTLVAYARLINLRSYKDLEKGADLIVVARPVSTTDTAEQTILHGISPDIQVVGLSSEFEIIAVFKGDAGLKKLVVHHYRLASPKQMMMNAPMLASFDPKDSAHYLLFLQREPDGRYAPFDQIDPLWSSLLKLNNPKWDSMTRDDFKKWVDAQRWQRTSPNPGSAISPEITAEGRADGSLHEAAMNGNLEKARALLKTNPELVLSHASYGNLTPLQLYGHADVARLLLANNAELEAKSYGGWTPLLSAVFGGDKDLVELLLTNKADVNYQEDAGRSPLHVAAENGYTEIAALLLANHASVNVRNREGDTPLHLAAARGDHGLAELLLINQADINARDNNGRTPLGFAILHNNPDMAGLLRQHGGVE